MKIGIKKESKIPPDERVSTLLAHKIIDFERSLQILKLY